MEPTELINSVLLHQPIESVVTPETLGRVVNLAECRDMPDESATQACVDSRMVPLVNQFLTWSDQAHALSDFVELTDGTQGNPQELCGRNFFSYIEIAKAHAEKGQFDEMAKLIKVAVLFGRMGKLDKEMIRKHIVEIVHIEPKRKEVAEEKQETHEDTKTETTEEDDDPKRGLQTQEKEIIIEKPPDIKKEQKTFLQRVKEYGVRLNGGFFLSADINPARSYSGLGGYVEMLVPFKARSSWVFGGELDLRTKFGFNGWSVFDDKLKTVEGEIFPVLNVGYRSASATVLLQTGVWFTYQHLFNVTQNDSKPYSDNFFDNLNLRLGVKAYLAKNYLLLSAGYQKNPWGDGAYLELGTNFKMWGEP